MNDDQHRLPLVFPQDMLEQKEKAKGEPELAQSTKAHISSFNDRLREEEDKMLYDAISIYLKHHDVFKKA